MHATLHGGRGVGDGDINLYWLAVDVGHGVAECRMNTAFFR